MLYPDAPGSPELAEPAGQALTDGFKRRTVCIFDSSRLPDRLPLLRHRSGRVCSEFDRGARSWAQVLHMARTAGPLTNVVVMGMGEPFMKFDVTWQALESLVDPARFGMGARRITVSTSGEVPGIERMTREKLQINLAVSLHAPDDELRNVLVPLNRKFPLKPLMRTVTQLCHTDPSAGDVRVRADGQGQRSSAAGRGAGTIAARLALPRQFDPAQSHACVAYRRTPYERVREFERILNDSGIPTRYVWRKASRLRRGAGSSSSMRRHWCVGQLPEGRNRIRVAPQQHIPCGHSQVWSHDQNRCFDTIG